MRFLFFPLLFAATALFAQAAAEKRYELLPAESPIRWHGENFGGAGGHEGTIQAQSGYLTLNGAQLTKGEFVLDMTSIRNTDIRDAQGRQDLEEHLKNDDFFETGKFPKAFFSLTKAQADPSQPDHYTITGLLGIKGITNSITFPAVITRTAAGAKATATIIIDRTKWNVTFQSKTIFATLKEGALADEIRINLDLHFKAK